MTPVPIVAASPSSEAASGPNLQAKRAIANPRSEWLLGLDSIMLATSNARRGLT